jgi:hypothetical protein
MEQEEMGAADEWEGWRMAAQAWFQREAPNMAQEGWRLSDPLWLGMRDAFPKAFESGVVIEAAPEGVPAQGELVVDKLGEQCKRKLQQMEADSPAVIVIAYMCIIARLGKRMRIGMDPLRGVYRTVEGLV